MLLASRDEDGFRSSIHVLKSPPLDLIRIIEQHARTALSPKADSFAFGEKAVPGVTGVSLQSLPLDL